MRRSQHVHVFICFLYMSIAVSGMVSGPFSGNEFHTWWIQTHTMLDRASMDLWNFTWIRYPSTYTRGDDGGACSELPLCEDLLARRQRRPTSAWSRKGRAISSKWACTLTSSTMKVSTPACWRRGTGRTTSAQRGVASLLDNCVQTLGSVEDIGGSGSSETT
jgi:hypothetical protein